MRCMAIQLATAPDRVPQRMDSAGRLRGLAQDAGMADPRHRADDHQPVAAAVGRLPPQPLVRRCGGPSSRDDGLRRRHASRMLFAHRSRPSTSSVRRCRRGRVAPRTDRTGAGSSTTSIPIDVGARTVWRRSNDGSNERSDRPVPTQSELERAALDALEHRRSRARCVNTRSSWSAATSSTSTSPGHGSDSASSPAVVVARRRPTATERDQSRDRACRSSAGDGAVRRSKCATIPLEPPNEVDGGLPPSPRRTSETCAHRRHERNDVRTFRASNRS